MTIERAIKPQESKEQRLLLVDREKLSVSGVREVISFGEVSVVLDTNMGILTVKGEGLKIIAISTEEGNAEIAGKISDMEYKKAKEKQSLMRTLFK